jgi:hypothetical protein
MVNSFGRKISGALFLVLSLGILGACASKDVPLVVMDDPVVVDNVPRVKNIVVPMTNDVIDQVGEERLEDYQYNISASILLTRRARAASSGGGDIRTILQTQRSEIQIDSDTPCRVTGYDFIYGGDNARRIQLEVGFEKLPNGSIPTLRFSTNWNPDSEEMYYLLFEDLENHVMYNGESYRASFLDGAEMSGENRPYLNIMVKDGEIKPRSALNRRRAGGLGPGR